MIRNILTISKREITRLRTRFSGKSRIAVVAILALALVSSYIIYHQDIAISKGLYIIGVSADGPTITDPRFQESLLRTLVFVVASIALGSVWSG